MILFLPVWLVGWAFGLAAATGLLSSFTTGRLAFAPMTTFMVVWLVFWTYGGLMTIYSLAFTLAGREELTIDGSTLRHAWRIVSLPAGRTRDYDLGHVRDLRATAEVYDPWGRRSSWQFWGAGGGTIAFDYGAKTVRLGAGVDEAEAKDLVERIRKRLPIQAA